MLSGMPGSGKPKGARMRGPLRFRYAIDLSRVTLLDKTSDHAGGLLEGWPTRTRDTGCELVRVRSGSSIAHVCVLLLCEPHDDAGRIPVGPEGSRQ